MLKGLQLTILAGPVFPVPLPSVFIDSLESVSAQTGDQHGFELKFVLDKRSPLPTLLTVQGMNLPDFRVILIATLRGIPHVIADGIVVHHQVDTSSPQPRLIIQGEGVAVAMDRDDLSNLVKYPGMPPTLRVAAILAKYLKYGIIPLVVPSLGNGVPDPMKRTPEHRGTDLGYIQYLAREVGNEFFILPGPVPGSNLAYWGPTIRLGLPQPPLNADMDVHRNVESMNFTVNAEQYEQPVVYIQEETTKLSIPIPIPAFSPFNPPMGIVRPAARKTSRVANTSKKSFVDALVQGFAQSSGVQDTVTAKGSLNVMRYGHVMKAKNLVSVRGATAPYDGLYYVDQVSHSIERGKYTQSFQLKRDGLVSTLPLAPMIMN